MTALATGVVTKQPSENPQLSVDFALALGTGETLSGTPTVTVEAVESGSGETSDLTITSITIDGAFVKFFVDGGTHNTVYRLEVEVETSESQTLASDCLLVVNDGTSPLTAEIDPKSLHPNSITYSDALEFLQGYTESGGHARSLVDMKTSVLSAYHELRSLHAKWNHYISEFRIWLNAQYTTGTVSYDHTGHANGERALTFSTAPPSWMVNGRVRVGEDVYVIQQATADATVFLLDPNVAPAADFSATAFTAYQTHYPLPELLQNFEEVIIEEGPWETNYIPQWEWLRHERRALIAGRTWGWTIMPDRKRHGSYSLAVFPIPTEVESVGFIFRRGINALRWSGEEAAASQGTASGSAGTKVVAITGGDIRDTMVGSILRLTSSTSTKPTGLAGVNPYDEQHMIVARSGNNLTLATPLVNTYATVKYQVSDLIDIATHMNDAFYAGLRWKYRQHTNNKDMFGSMNDFHRLTRLAKENDGIAPRLGPKLAAFIRTYETTAIRQE